MDILFYNYFTSAFVHASPKVLLKNYNEKLLKSLKSLFGSAERALKIELDELKICMSEVKTERSLSPKIYALHAFLQEGIRQGSIKNVTKSIEQIGRLLKEERIYTEIFLIQTVSSDDWEQQILRDLKEQNRNMEGGLPTLTSLKEEVIRSTASIISEALELLKQISLIHYFLATYVK